MDDEAIRALVTRLARPHPSGGTVIARAAILAEGADFDEVVRWITEHDGTPESATRKVRSQGLHGARTGDGGGGPDDAPRRFVLPPGALR